nr:hypothetical protein [Tanacetum cinerariifolium]
MANVNVNAPADQALQWHHLLVLMIKSCLTSDGKHKFHPRPDSPLYFPNEELVLGYLKLSAKGTKQEVFRMPIPNKLIIADIQGEPYYKEYLEKVAKHQRYLAGEKGSDPDSPAPKPAKATKKSKPSAPKADLRPPVTKPASSQQPESKPAPANSLRSIDESIDEGIPKKELRFDDEEADVQRALEESLKSVYDVPRGPLPSVVIREPDSGKYQPLPEVQGKGKEKAGPNPSEQDEGQTGPNLGDATTSQPQSSHVVHVGPNLEQMDLEAMDVSTQLHPEQMDKGPDSPNVHRPLQAMAIETTTTTTTTHPPPPQPQQSTTDSMLIKRIGELEQIMANLIQDNKHLEERLDSHGAPLEKSMNRDHTDELDLAEAHKKKKKRRDSPKTLPGSPPHQPPPPPPPTGPSGTSGSHRAFGSSQVPPSPPPPPSTYLEGQSHGSTAPSSSKTAASTEYKAWTMTDIRLRQFVSSTPEDLHIDDDMAPDAQVHTFDDEDIGNAYIPKTCDMAMFMDWFCKGQGITKLKPQDLEGPAFELVKVFHPNVIYLRYQMEECHKLLSDSVDDSIIKHNVNKPLPLGGLPGQVTIQSDFFFNKDLKYLRYGSNGGRPALSISKMKAAYYPDVGLEQIVPDQMWIEEECKYDIVAMYGISHWWFQRQRFYIDRHTSEGNCRAVRTHMRILSVVRIKVFSMYGYNYMKKIVLRRADLNEHIIAERDFKYLYLSDFEDLYLLILQGYLNHLPPKDKKILTTAVNLWTRHLVIRQRVKDFQLGIESYQTQLNLTKPRWDAT